MNIIRKQIMTRRQILMAGAASPLFCSAAARAPRFSMETYIWIQYAERNHKTLGECLDEVIPMAPAAGFKNVEMNQNFFTPELRDKSKALLVSNGLRVPSVYVGGAMHTHELAEETIKNAIEIAGFSKPLGCRAIVTDPIPKPQRARKSDAELAVQTESLNRLGRELSRRGVQLWVHNHDAEMVENAREWRSNLTGTDPKYVWMCIDLDWVHQGGQDLLGLLREAGKRVAALHLRNSKNRLWLESFSDGDIDYRKIAAYLKPANLSPLLVVELAYRKETTVTQPLVEDLRISRLYAEKIFGAKARV